MLNTPVLLIVFNRPETTRRVFEEIRKVKPKELFIAADGPRPDKLGEAERCEEVRKIVTNVDWDCEVKTLFRSANIGCGLGPSEAITWFFENVEQGIILEDDCLPSISFFTFAECLLNRYKNEENIFLISGTNPLDIKIQTEESYFFTNYAGIWGWATWRRAWKNFDFSMKSWINDKNKEAVSQFFKNKNARDYYIDVFNKTFQENDVSWWDYQWYYARIINKGIGIVPKKNLISNIGFGKNATHTFNEEDDLAKLKTYELGELIHPKEIAINKRADNRLLNYSGFPNPSFVNRLKNLHSKIYNRVFLRK